MAELLKPLAGTPIVLRIDARGKLIDIKFPETWTEVFKGQAAFELAGLLGHLISAPGLKGQLLVPIIELPEKLPAAGESWTRGRELEVWNIPETRAALSWTDAYTYQGDEQHGAASLAKLAMTRTETFTVKPRDSEPHTQKRAFQGELLFDRAKGRIIECRLKEERTSGESTVTVVLINKENITNSVQQATAGSHGKVKPSTDPEKPDQTDKPGPGGEVNRVPRLLEPAEGAVLRNRAATWDFKWSEIPGATGYELYVIGSRATIPVIDVKTNKPSYRYQHGGYVIDRNRRGWTWRVRAVVDGQPLPWSKPQTFDVEPLGP
ncbi:MAG: hypothetical protein MUF54_15495 [Polyangiaceae bacterium]|nr:hypothetical protein [Polyangiaceae bacterium]